MQNPNSPAHEPDLQGYRSQIECAKQRLVALQLRIEEERNRRGLLDQLQAGGTESEGGIEQSELSSYENQESSNSSSRYIADQFAQISKYMETHFHNEQPVNPFATKPNPNLNQPRPLPNRAYPYQQQWLKQTQKQIQRYRSNTVQYLEERSKEDYGRLAYLVEERDLKETRKNGRRRKSIFQGGRAVGDREDTISEKEIEVYKNINKKYKQFQQHQQRPQIKQQPYQIPTYPAIPDPNLGSQPFPILSQLSQKLQIIPATEKRHIQCLQMLNNETAKYRNILKRSQKEGSRCIRLASTIREIGIYERILSRH